MFRCLFLSVFIAIFATPPAVHGEPLITELMAAGQSVIKDEDHASPDWLELYNPDATPVALGGWHLSDSAGKSKRWTFPPITLPPGGYVVVFASGKNRKPLTGNLHTNFGLDGSGGAVLLTRPDGSVAQTFSYAGQLPDVSWDGAHFLSHPTPGGANAPAEEPITQAPEFSQQRGFQTGPFALTMTSGTPGAAIFYTLDGSVPDSTATRYTTPLSIAKTTVVRAVAIAPSKDESPLAVRTFLFPADIVKQSANGRAPKGWPMTWGEHTVDYGMDRAITAKAPYAATIKDDLRAVPSFSVVMPLDDLFDADSGFYSHPNDKGAEWERAMSLEYIEPTGGGGFQIPGGIRIRGGASRDSGNPKHSLQFRFRTEYGAANLDYPLFGEDGPARSDGFDLRWDHLVSWHYSNTPDANQLQDIFARDAQLAASGVAKRGNLCNLYINRQYWGLFFIDERVNGDFGANHFGGSSEDYDVMRYDAEQGSTGLNGGTRRAWREAFDLGHEGFAENARYFRALGRNPDGSRNPGYERLIDEENLIDYMLVGIWCGATDNPVVGGTDNNWTSIRARNGDFGYRFFVHDFELSMFELDGNYIGENPQTNELAERNAESINPWHFWMAMRMNAEFRMKVADRVQKHFFNGGALTADACVARWNARMQEMDRAIVAESARWGDSEAGGGWGGPIFDLKIRPPDGGGPKPGGEGKRRAYTRADWLGGATAKRDDYIAQRSEKMLQHLRDGALYPSTPAPTMSPFGGTLPVGGTVELLNANGTGTIYYTLNGPDPRLVGGAISPEAQAFATPFALARKTTVRARVLDGGSWSALVEAEFLPGVDFGALRLTEIHYNPAVEGAETADDGEFIELKNTGPTTLDLSGCTFSEGIEFTFPAGTSLAPGAFFVLVRNATVFAQKHPGVVPDGVFNGKLGDDGESLVITTSTGTRIFALEYDDEAPWPLAADGYGPSLVYDGKGNPDDGKNWHASSANGGSPGADDPAPAHLSRVVVNEVAATFIELHNPGPAAADISGWKVGTDRALPTTIPASTVIPSGGFYLLPLAELPAGGAAFLYSVPPSYAHELRFGPLESGISFGRHINGDGEERFVAMAPTPDAANGAPLSRSPLRISEIFYASGLDFVELENSGDAPISLAGMRLAGMNYVVPAGMSLGAGERLIISKASEAEFRAVFPTEGTTVLGPTPGDLQDNGERVALEEPYEDGWRVLDEVRYNDRFPWPVGAAGAGDSLHRLPLAYADESAAWTVGSPTPGAKGVDGRPRVVLTSPGDLLETTAGTALALAATAWDVDGSVAKVEFFVDGRSIGEDFAVPYEFTWRAEPGTHDLSARAFDQLGNFGDSEPVTIFASDDETRDGGAGLKAEYFANTTLSGTAVETTVDTVNFDWSELPPAEGIPHLGFSARFSGKLLPRESGSHTIYFRHAGGLRVTIGGNLLIDAWSEPEIPEGETTAYSEVGIDLIAGEPVDLVVEYFDSNAHGSLSLSWYEPTNFADGPIPQTQLFLPDQDVNAFGISTPSRIPQRKLGQRIRVALETTRGVSPNAWRLVGGALPAGIELNPAGSLGGTASAGGDFSFRLEAMDAAGALAERTFSLHIVSTEQGDSRPKVRLITPSAEVTSAPIAVTGTASSKAPLVSLEYSLNRGVRHPFSPSENWHFALDRLRGIMAGENTIQVFATDSQGREGSSPERKFRYRYRSPLNVSISGGGSVTPGFIGTSLRYVGDDLTITAQPAPGWIFSRWEPNFEPSARLTFSMRDNTDLTAVFIKNPFIPFAGKYVGLIGDGIHQGRYDIAMSKTGNFTMSLQIAGSRTAISGALSAEGRSDSYHDPRENLPNYVSVVTRFDTGEVVVAMEFFRFDFAEVYESIAKPANWSADCPAAGAWTLTFPSPTPDIPGHGYAVMNITRNGLVTLRGRAGDGSLIRAGLCVANDETMPFSTPLSENGSIAGALNYRTEMGRQIDGELNWFSDSFAGPVSAGGAPYKAPAIGTSAIVLPLGVATFTDANPSDTLTMSARLNSRNTFVFPTPGNALPVLSVDPLTGFFHGSYIHPATHKNTIIRGVVNQLTNSAAGVIAGKTPGGITILPMVR